MSMVLRYVLCVGKESAGNMLRFIYGLFRKRNLNKVKVCDNGLYYRVQQLP